ncbi:MAG: hypothetical protein C0627_00440 [Sulfurimonas sp.]|nr:MAG: hypothetical protein C0627_00440 [Sulfurimonas sp.]
MIKLGDTIELTVEEARAKCIELKKHNHQLITQPQEPQINPITFQQFYDTHYLPYIHTHIKSYETNISVFKNHIISHLANTPMKDLKKNQVMQYHSSMVKDKNLAPATANKFLIFLSNAYKLSHDFELLPNDINPCKGIKEFELNNQRQIFLTNTQAKRLLKYVELSPNQHLQFIIPMLLLSGARKREVLDAQWSDFDTLNNFWTIPITKNGKKRILPITPPLQELLESIPKQSKYLFASPKTKKPYVSIFNSWNTARIKAGLPEVRIHDLRHTYASSLVNAKCSLYEVQMLLGHSTAKMTQRYAHLSNESLMKASSHAGKLLK